MNDERKYVRLYYSVIDDPKFESIYGDDAAWAAYTRLLMLADSMWPASPPIPKSCKPAAFRKLVNETIVDVLPGGKFRIHGLDAERERRKESAVRSASARRTPSERSANAFDVHQLAEPSQAKHIQAEPSQADNDDPVSTYYVLTTRTPRGRALDWCKRLGEQYGYRATSDAMSEAWGDADEVSTLLSRTEDKLVLASRSAERAERAAELARLREKRERRFIPVEAPDPQKVADIMGELRERLTRPPEDAA